MTDEHQPQETASASPSRALVRQMLERVRSALARSHSRRARGLELLSLGDQRLAISAEAMQASDAIRAQLHESVAGYTRQLRSEGLPCERVLVQVKSAMRASMPRDLHGPAGRALIDDAVRWSIEAYYQ